MPVYLYQGIESGETFNLEQRISEAALTHHPKNGEPVKRLIGKPAISFKGSGFYANDSKNTASSKPEAKADAPKAETSSDSPNPDSPKTDAPKTDAPKTDSPKAESSSPAVETKAPVSPAPKSDAA